MEYLNTTKTIKVNNHPVEVSIIITVNDDEPDLLMDQSWDSPEQEAAYRQKIEQGSVFCGWIHVTAKALTLEGFDSIGGCELIPNNYFDSTPFNESVDSVLDTYGMIDNACKHLKQLIKDHTKNCKQKASQLLEEAERFAVYND